MPGCCFFQEVYQLGQDNFGTTENTAIQILLCNKVVTMQLFSHQNFSFLKSTVKARYVIQIPSTCFVTSLRCKLQREAARKWRYSTTHACNFVAQQISMLKTAAKCCKKSWLLLNFATICCNLQQKSYCKTSCTCVAIHTSDQLITTQHYCETSRINLLFVLLHLNGQ